MSWLEQLSACDRCKLAWVLILAGVALGAWTWLQKRAVA